MIKITKTDGSNIFYKCSCGVFGVCTIKPLSDVGEKIVNITCPNCNYSVLETYTKNCNFENEDTIYSLVLVVNNKILEE